MIFDLLGRCAESDTDFEKEKVRNRRYDNRKIFKLLSVGIVLVTALSMLVGCGKTSEDEKIPDTAIEDTIPETTVEDNADTASDSVASISDIDAISDIAIGEYVTFGSYEQDADFDNGPEPIEWMVLDHQDGRTLLLAKYGLDASWYHVESADDVTWETCNLRRWLNTDFYNTAFDDTEKNLIVQTTNENLDGTTFWENIGREVYSSIGGNDTQDNVFLLSLYEAQTYLGLTADGNSDCRTTATLYAETQGAYSPGKECWWWLRSPGSEICSAAVVKDSGSALAEFVYHEYKKTPAVRPAIWVGEGIHGEITDLPSIAEPEKEDAQAAPADNTEELTADGCGGLYSGSQQGRYYYVWVEMGEFSGIDAPMGTIRLLWEGNEPYTEGNELSQDPAHDFYMGDVDDVYMIEPGWNNEDSSILTIDQDEFGEYSGKIFCFGFWMNKDNSLIYDGTSLRYRN